MNVNLKKIRKLNDGKRTEAMQAWKDHTVDDNRITAVYDNGRRGEPMQGCDCIRCFGYCIGPNSSNSYAYDGGNMLDVSPGCGDRVDASIDNGIGTDKVIGYGPDADEATDSF